MLKHRGRTDLISHKRTHICVSLSKLICLSKLI